jgi:hypothetical protein
MFIDVIAGVFPLSMAGWKAGGKTPGNTLKEGFKKAVN